MSKDHARLTVLLDPEKKKAFDALCAELGTNASHVLRELIAQYLAGDEPATATESMRRTRHEDSRVDDSAEDR